MNILEDDQIIINLNGSAGQSLGAFSVKGTTLKISGDANDYVAKGLSGGKLVITPPEISSLQTNKNVIIGILVCMEQLKEHYMLQVLQEIDLQ